jgi:hypothetical protein
MNRRSGAFHSCMRAYTVPVIPNTYNHASPPHSQASVPGSPRNRWRARRFQPFFVHPRAVLELIQVVETRILNKEVCARHQMLGGSATLPSAIPMTRKVPSRYGMHEQRLVSQTSSLLVQMYLSETFTYRRASISY